MLQQKKSDGKIDNVLYLFEEIGEMIINENMLPNEVKDLAIKFVKEKKKIDLDPKIIRLREKIGERVIRIYRDIPMKKQILIQKRQIALEILEKESEIYQFFQVSFYWVLEFDSKKLENYLKDLKLFLKKIV